MNETADETKLPDSLVEMKPQIFWLKLALGLGFGALAYFIERFNSYIVVYILAPILYLASCLIIFLYVYQTQKKNENIKKSTIGRFVLNYTAIWIIAYSVISIVFFYYGW